MSNTSQPSLSMLGNIRRTSSKFNPNLAETIRQDMEEEAREAEKARRLGKNKPQAPDVKVPETTAPIQIPNSQYFYLTKEIFDETLGRIKKDYADNEALLKVKWNQKENRAEGSNIYYTALINTLYRNQGIRTATQADLEEVLRTQALTLTGTYEDSGIVLRSLAEPNEYLAKQIANQIAKLQGKTVKDLQFLFYIPSRDLDLTNDANSPSKLGFRLLDTAEIIYAPIFNSQSGSKFLSSDINTKTGLPNKLSSGDRTLYTRSDGLSGLYLGRDLGLGSDNGNLASSDENGRVLLASASQGTKPAQKNGGTN